MTIIDLPGGAPVYDTRSRAFRRPALTTLILMLIMVMIVRDVLRRRRLLMRANSD